MKKKMVEPFLDGEVLFTKYFSMGAASSVSVLTRFAIANGMRDSRGNNPTRMGVWKAMWRWASLEQNKSKAFEIFNKYIDEHGWVWGDRELQWDGGNRHDLWQRFMLQKIKSAWQYKTPAMENRFLKKNGWTS